MSASISPSFAGHRKPRAANKSGIRAKSFILVDAVSGQVLHENNADTLRPPASTTKIMTAILLLENCRPDEILTADKIAAETGGASLHLKVGEKVTARDMLYGLMLRSANDGCVTVAEHIAGTEQRFAEMMTAKAHRIGATQTTFRNCNGLNCPDHLTTARDLATIARYAIKYPEFNEATKSKFHTITRDSTNHDVVLKNHAKFLWKNPDADGIKTGWTVPAGHCFVGSATVNGWRLISVVLNSPDIVEDTQALMKFGYSQFRRDKVLAAGSPMPDVNILNGTRKTVMAHAASDVYVISPIKGPSSQNILPMSIPVSAPIQPGTKIGSVQVVIGGKILSQTDILSDSAVEAAPKLTPNSGIKWLGVLTGAMGLIVIGYGSSFAKAARCRRYRLKAKLRDNDPRWKSAG